MFKGASKDRQRPGLYVAASAEVLLGAGHRRLRDKERGQQVRVWVRVPGRVPSPRHYTAHRPALPDHDGSFASLITCFFLNLSIKQFAFFFLELLFHFD